MSSKLLSPWTIRELSIRNRILVSPMCQYSATDGMAAPWHLVHLGGMAAGGAGLVMAEASAVVPEGRISPGDLGLWSAAHGEALQPIAAFIASQGAIPAIQLAHAGRKASTAKPWEGGMPLAAGQGGWPVKAPSPKPFAPGYPVPQAMTHEDIAAVVTAFEQAARRALESGFQVVELHMAHGYLLDSFLSPLANERSDAYGGTLEGRARLPLEVARAVRQVWPQHLPLFARLSVVDWYPGGFTLDEAVTVAGWLHEAGVDLIDCSSGGMVPDAEVPFAPGYQTPFAAAIRERAGVPTGAVGLITEPIQAEHILVSGQADCVFIGRAMLRDPHWALRAAVALGDKPPCAQPYHRAY